MKMVSTMAHFLLGVVFVVSWIRVAFRGLPSRSYSGYSWRTACDSRSLAFFRGA
jgi:hypothetical protein